jgi:hypothetical protein
MKTMRTGFSIAGVAAAILLLLFSAPAVSAQNQDYPDQGSYDQDPPTRAGRIGYVEGSVSFQPGGEGDWVTAVPNRPLTVGDNLWVDRDSRAEIQIGSTSIRLAPETSITILNLANEVTQLRLSLGSVIFRVRHFGSDDAFEVDTPNLAFNVASPGEYRLDVNENGDQTTAEVFQGEGQITGAGNSYRLMEGQRGVFSGVDQLSYDVDQIASPDNFYRWARSRDEREDRFRSAEYVSTDMTGYADLDDYGRWENVSGYGYVWSPVGVPYDWAPYRYGHWVYVAPWGWTWVEDEPWGFAPFHYGRWAFVRSRWCWVPGPVLVRPVYAPALVAFIGGSNFSIGVGFGGGVGWFPLAPGEVYVPWYRTSPRYVQNVNVTNTRVTVVQVTNVYNNYTTHQVTNIRYVNKRVTNSVTVVNHDTFVNARPVNRNIVRVDSQQIQRAQVAPAEVRNFQPQRQSVIGVARQVNYRPPQQAISRPVVATRQPTIASRPLEVPNVGRVTAPPVRTVRAVPVSQAQPLQRGARGNAGGPVRNEAAPRGPENNRPPAAENNRGNPRPNASERNAGAENNRGVPRPGAAENRGENNHGNARSNAPENAAPRTGNGENQPGAENNPRGRAVPRPNAPDNNPDVSPRNNPNPPMATPRSDEGGRPNREASPREPNPDNQPARVENNGRSSAPRPPSNETRQPAPERPRGNGNGNGSENAQPRGNPKSMDQPPRAPEVRETPPQRSEVRNEPAPRQETRPAQSRGNNEQAHGEGKGNGNGNGNGGQNRNNRDNPPPHFR